MTVEHSVWQHGVELWCKIMSSARKTLRGVSIPQFATQRLRSCLGSASWDCGWPAGPGQSIALQSALQWTNQLAADILQTTLEGTKGGALTSLQASSWARHLLRKRRPLRHRACHHPLHTRLQLAWTGIAARIRTSWQVAGHRIGCVPMQSSCKMCWQTSWHAAYLLALNRWRPHASQLACLYAKSSLGSAHKLSWLCQRGCDQAVFAADNSCQPFKVQYSTGTDMCTTHTCRASFQDYVEVLSPVTLMSSLTKLEELAPVAGLA